MVRFRASAIKKTERRVCFAESSIAKPLTFTLPQRGCLKLVVTVKKFHHCFLDCIFLCRLSSLQVTLICIAAYNFYQKMLIYFICMSVVGNINSSVEPTKNSISTERDVARDAILGDDFMSQCISYASFPVYFRSV